MMRRNQLCLAVFLGALSLGANPRTAAASAQAEGASIPLSFIEIPESNSSFPFRYFILEEEEPTRIPFATESGGFLVQRKGDALWVDQDGNGKIDPEEGRPFRKGDVFHVRVRHGQGWEAYPMRILQMQPRAVYLETRAALLGHKGEFLVAFLDQNLDGVFGQEDLDTFKLERFTQEKMLGLATSGDDPFWNTDLAPLGRVVYGLNALYDLSVEGEVRAVLRPHAGETARIIVKTQEPSESQPSPGLHLEARKEGGKIVVRPIQKEAADAGPELEEYSFLLAQSEGAQYQRMRPGVEALLVPGDYRMTDLSLVLSFPAGQSGFWIAKPEEEPRRTAFLLGDKESRPRIVTLAPGDNTLELGPPFTLDFEASVWGDQHDQFSVEKVFLRGAGGEDYRPQFTGEVQSYLQYCFQSGNEELFLGNIEPNQQGMAFSWRGIPAEVRADDEARVVMHFSAPGLEPIKAEKRLSDLKSDYPPGAVLLQRASKAMRELRFADAAAQFKEAARIYPENALVQNDSAWYLLTMESESDRDPKAALDMALRAVKLTDFQNGLLLDTYALALYQVGNLDEAVKYQKIAVALEPANVELKRRLEELLDLQKKAGP